MSTRQYIGARYVPIFSNPVEWDSARSYEALTIVTNLGNSYTSRKPVPSGVEIGNTEYWVCTGNYNAQLQQYIDAFNDCPKIFNNVSELESSEYVSSGAVVETLGFYNANDGGGAKYIITDLIPSSEYINVGDKYGVLVLDIVATPEMFGAYGDGIQDDTEAFNKCANLPVYISDKSYKLTEKVGLNNVIANNGTYTLYEPMYKRNNTLDLNGLTFGSNIRLNVSTSYAECGLYLNNKYYLICQNYDNSPATSYVSIYDSAFQHINTVDLDASHGVANNCCTDGNRIYVSFNNKDVISFDENVSNVTTILTNSYYNFYEYWNKTFWGILLDTNTLTVAELENDLVTVKSSWSVPFKRQVLQSASVIDGTLYIPSTKGTFNSVDMYSHEITSITYNGNKEIEKIFKTDKILCVGHIYAVNGIANIGEFNNGVDYPKFEYIPLDASNGDFNSLLTSTGAGDSIYKITNGTSMGLPANTGDLIITDISAIFIHNDLGIFKYYNNKWICIVRYSPKYVTIVTDHVYLGTDANGMIFIWFAQYELTQASKTISINLEPIFDGAGVTLNTIRGNFIGRQSGAIGSSDIYFAQVDVTKTGATFYIKNITNLNSSVVSCVLNGKYYLG